MRHRPTPLRPRQLLGLVVLALLGLTWSLPAAADGTAVRRFSLLVGANNGGAERLQLRYAQSDAESVAQVLRELGGVWPQDSLLLLEPDRTALLAGLEMMAGRLGQARREGLRLELLFYYSGHSDESGILLGDGRVMYKEVRERIKALPADVHLIVLDSCASGALTRGKGGKRRPPFLVDASAEVRGHAYLTSASIDEQAQESERVGGSFFTHYLVSGLRGAADDSGDRRVTLNEAYHHAFHETLARTESTRGGPQHPNYDIQLAGSGDLVLTDLRGTSALLVFDKGLRGRVFVRDARRRLVAEINKREGEAMSLGLEPGLYEVTYEQPAEVRRGAVTLAEGEETAFRPAELTVVETEVAVARGPGPEPAASSGDPDEEPAGRAEAQITFTNQTVGVSFVPGVSNYAKAPGRVRHRFAFNFLGLADDLNGFELSGLGAMRRHDVSGGQVAGAFNYTHGAMRAAQGAGFANLVLGEATGFQGAGLFNYAGGGWYGLQAAGLANIARGTDNSGLQVSGFGNLSLGGFKGFQGADFGNVTHGPVDGLQVAGFGNVATGRVRGAQVAGFFNYAGSPNVQLAGFTNIAGGELVGLQLSAVFNYADHVDGLQLGLINVAGTSDGAGLGLLSVAGDGLLEPTVWTSDTGFESVGLKVGSRKVYGLFAIGHHDFDDERWTSVINGLGGHIELDPFYLDIDVVTHWLQDKHDWGQNNIDLVSKLRVTVGWRVLDQFSLYVGPTLNFLASEIRDHAGLWDATFWSDTSGDVNYRLWPGLVFGLQAEPQWGRLNPHRS